MGIDVAGHVRELVGTGAILVTAAGYAIGPMLVKHRLAGLDPRATIGASLALASLILSRRRCADRPHAASRRPARSPPSSFLGLVCTAVAFVVYSC